MNCVMTQTDDLVKKLFIFTCQ